MTYFQRLKSEYRNQFNANEFTIEDAEKWVAEITQAGITEPMYEYGKALGLKQQYIPKRCFDFIQLCKRYISDSYPSLEDSYQLAVKNKYRSNPCIYEAYRRIGSFSFQTKSEEYLRKAWSKTYPKVIAEHHAGKHFEIPKQIEHKHFPASASEAKKHLNDAKAMQGSPEMIAQLCSKYAQGKLK